MVMRLLPNRMRVSIVERTPVAFVRQGSHIGLVDANGVLLDMPVDAKAGDHYSFPVVTGIAANDPLSTRAARMKIFGRFTSELDGSGEKISEELSEVDLSNPEDVKATIPDHSTEILVHFGEDSFLDRYRRFKEHLPEWKTLYPKLSSVDMRYERQVVLEMQPGSGGSAVSSSNSASVSSNAGAPTEVDTSTPKHVDKAAARPIAKPVDKPTAKASTIAAHPATTSHSPAPKPATKALTAHNEVAFDVPSKKNAPGKNVSGAKTHPIVKRKLAAVKTAVNKKQSHSTQVVHP
jgi:cell division protein FtsQ